LQFLFSVAAVLFINPVLGACALVLCFPMALAPIVAKRPVDLARHGTAVAMDILHYGAWIIGGLLIMHGRMSVADIVANQEIMDIGSPEQVHASIEKLNLIIEH
jgi:hypothetical protein